MHDDKVNAWYDRMGKARPSSDAHGTPEEIRANLKQAQVTSWHLEGNVLHAESDLGPFAQVIPTDYICTGMDLDGMPILVKLSL